MSSNSFHYVIAGQCHRTSPRTASLRHRWAMSSNSIPVFDDIVHVERAASMTLSRRQRAELPEESISMYLMYGDEITLTRGTGALWQLGAGPASLIDLVETLRLSRPDACASTARGPTNCSKRRRAGLAARHRAPQRQAQCLAAPRAGMAPSPTAFDSPHPRRA